MATIHFFTPLINEKKSTPFTLLINFVETYLNIGTCCYKFISMKADGRIAIAESKLPKHHWIQIALKIASSILSFGLFPLTMLIIKSLYRAYHPLFIDAPILSNQPKEILQKIFTEFLSSSLTFLQYANLNRHFNHTINHEFIKWEDTYIKMTESTCKKEEDAFIQRIKILYTRNREPSFKQKVQFLCYELWEDAKQVPEMQKIIQSEKLTITDLIKKEHYNRLKELAQPARNRSLTVMAMTVSQQSIKGLENLQSSEDFRNGDLEKQAYLIRDWFTSKESEEELINVTNISLWQQIPLLSMETLAYMALMPNLQGFHMEGNKLSVLPPSIGKLKQLQKLYIYNNQISSLPNEIGNLSKLQTLCLFRNQITSIPDSIYNLTKLKELNLNCNKISFLSNNIEKLSQLQELYLSYNQLSTLPNTIANLNQLQNLSLENNQLSTLPKAITKLRQLNQLNLKNNPISKIPKLHKKCRIMTNHRKLSYDN